jgi:adenosylcobinamide kinase / adenosylcobinamide-phosphate guanylyltransferase
LHQQQRPAAWLTAESPRSLHVAIGSARTLIVEDLTLLLNNLMLEAPAEAEARARDEVDAVLKISAHVILVSNEVGMGIVPATLLGREFRDALGRLNQHAAAAVEEAYFLVASLPLRLK